ncbi:helix-turn-helix transcriptional regulator [Paenibacillus sp. WLX2291]|uniref:helix-turn-helix transcriptional regulator n=1 Tax=Paenibacillus sp. WLX2291 TaxID=3296934 RepID=UPI003984252A
MEERSPKKLLGEFLRSRRQRLSPEEVGLVNYGRRRTSGLRREEVAQLAHIGTSWYTSLEQGREVNASQDVLDHIARALQLTEDERQYLHVLARPAQREEKTEDEQQQLQTGMQRTVMALEPNPAFVLDPYWNLTAWNRAAAFVFHLPAFSAANDYKINWIKHLLSGDRLGTDTQERNEKAQAIIAQFRADYAQSPNDVIFQKLVDEFQQTIPIFRERWPMHDVQAVKDRFKHFDDPRIGVMEFEHIVLHPSGNPMMKMMIYTASLDTATRLQAMLKAEV